MAVKRKVKEPQYSLRIRNRIDLFKSYKSTNPFPIVGKNKKINVMDSCTGHWYKSVDKVRENKGSFIETAPPIAEAIISHRILIVSVSSGFSDDMPEILSKWDKYHEYLFELKKEGVTFSKSSELNKNYSSFKLNTKQGSFNDLYKVHSVGRALYFWQAFFDDPFFIDNWQNITIPKAIITDGKLEYDRGWRSPENKNVMDVLRKVAKAWSIPVIYFPNWDENLKRKKKLKEMQRDPLGYWRRTYFGIHEM